MVLVNTAYQVFYKVVLVNTAYQVFHIVVLVNTVYEVFYKVVLAKFMNESVSHGMPSSMLASHWPKYTYKYK